MENLLNEPLKYQQIYNELYDLVTNSAAGEKLASERELAKTFNCNMLTIRKSLKMLAEEGLIEKRPRSGTFILERTQPVDNKKKTSGFISLMVHSGSDAYAYKLLEALAFEAGRYQLEVKTVWYKTFDDDLLKKMEALSDSGSAGFVFPWIPRQFHDDFLSFIDGIDLNITTTIRHEAHLDKYFDIERRVEIGNIKFTKAQVDYFQEIGYGNVAFIGPNDANNVFLKDRAASYLSVIGSLNLPAYIGLVDNTAEQIDILIKRWQGEAGNMAILCYDDKHALRVLTSLHKHGLQVPDDFAVMGFNDTEHAQFADPPLSTIAQDFNCHARHMLRHATANFEPKVPIDESSSKVTFVIRESCGGKEKISEAFLSQLADINIEYSFGS